MKEKEPTATDSEPVLPKISPSNPDKNRGGLTKQLQTSPAMLFRFSALTFNAHAIHLSSSWCRLREGHPDLVVHGPLNLVRLLDFWREQRSVDESLRLKSIDYRASAPVYVGQDCSANMESAESENIWIAGQAGEIAMQARIETF
jgi:hydroxyacyl-ACP dehydratase HTD2-like protein with hotdog domain